MRRTIQIIALLVFASIPLLAQETIDQKDVAKEYDEFSRLETIQERQALMSKISDEMKVALWHENIDRKTSGLTLTPEQSEIISLIRKKYLTVEFVKAAKGKNEADAGQDYQETMKKANEILGRELFLDLFAVLGDSKTLKKK